MPNSSFPPEIPNIGTLVRVTPVKIDYVVRHYKDFCEEAYVVSRFSATSYDGTSVIEVSLGGRMITEPLRFNPENQMWLTMFDDQDQQVQLEIIME